MSASRQTCYQTDAHIILSGWMKVASFLWNQRFLEIGRSQHGQIVFRIKKNDSSSAVEQFLQLEQEEWRLVQLSQISQEVVTREQCKVFVFSVVLKGETVLSVGHQCLEIAQQWRSKILQILHPNCIQEFNGNSSNLAQKMATESLDNCGKSVSAIQEQNWKDKFLKILDDVKTSLVIPSTNNVERTDPNLKNNENTPLPVWQETHAANNEKEYKTRHKVDPFYSGTHWQALGDISPRSLMSKFLNEVVDQARSLVGWKLLALENGMRISYFDPQGYSSSDTPKYVRLRASTRIMAPALVVLHLISQQDSFYREHWDCLLENMQLLDAFSPSTDLVSCVFRFSKNRLHNLRHYSSCYLNSFVLCELLLTNNETCMFRDVQVPFLHGYFIEHDVDTSNSCILHYVFDVPTMEHTCINSFSTAISRFFLLEETGTKSQPRDEILLLYKSWISRPAGIRDLFNQFPRLIHDLEESII